MTEQGIVKFWNAERGFGFIHSDGGHEHFFHVSQFRSGVEPNKNDRVSFTVGENERTGKTEAKGVALV